MGGAGLRRIEGVPGSCQDRLGLLSAIVRTMSLAQVCCRISRAKRRCNNRRQVNYVQTKKECTVEKPWLSPQLPPPLSPHPQIPNPFLPSVSLARPCPQPLTRTLGGLPRGLGATSEGEVGLWAGVLAIGAGC